MHEFTVLKYYACRQASVSADVVIPLEMVEPFRKELCQVAGVGLDNHTTFVFIDAKGNIAAAWFHDNNAHFGSYLMTTVGPSYDLRRPDALARFLSDIKHGQ